MASFLPDNLNFYQYLEKQQEETILNKAKLADV